MPPNTDPTLVDVEQLNDWVRRTTLRRKSQNTSPSSDRARRSRLRSLATQEGVCSLEALATHLEDRANLDRCINKLWGKYAPGSIRAFVDAIAVLGHYATEMGWVTTIPVQQSDRPVPAQKPIEVYTADDVALLIRLAKQADLRWWAFLCTMADTGRRVQEVLDLEWEHLHLDAAPPHFSMATSKNHRQQYVPLSKRLVGEVFTQTNIDRMVRETPKRHEAYHRLQTTFPFPWSYSVVRLRLQRDCARIGVTYRGFHNFRHTKATAMLAKGVPIQAVASLLGHSSVATTDRVYNHTTALSYAEYVG